ncbi:hypothetical protein PR048_027479 [Dryococelus australis]|uniref:Ionotropic glutamate receptor C-terminal domain-containing protein n=1 Tax=Dryococelus australis TaxID=614101 RepID=A0ABQ9GFP1_9NEOP|nr:hypothetical protein PR048_027479 [Dryococelus australis]
MDQRRNARGGGGGRDITEKTHLPVASSGTIPTCESPGVIRPGIEPGQRRTSTPETSLIKIILKTDDISQKQGTEFRDVSQILSYRLLDVNVGTAHLSKRNLHGEVGNSCMTIPAPDNYGQRKISSNPGHLFTKQGASLNFCTGPSSLLVFEIEKFYYPMACCKHYTGVAAHHPGTCGDTPVFISTVSRRLAQSGICRRGVLYAYHYDLSIAEHMRPSAGNSRVSDWMEKSTVFIVEHSIATARCVFVLGRGGGFLRFPHLAGGDKRNLDGATTRPGVTSTKMVSNKQTAPSQITFSEVGEPVNLSQPIFQRVEVSEKTSFQDVSTTNDIVEKNAMVNEALAACTSKVIDIINRKNGVILFIINEPHSSETLSDVYAYFGKKLRTSAIILDVDMYPKWEEMFPKEISFSGKIPRVVGIVFIAARFSDTFWQNLRMIKTLPFWDPQTQFVLVLTSVTSHLSMARTWEEFRIVNFLVISQCVGYKEDGCKQKAICTYAYDQFGDVTSVMQFDTKVSMKNLLRNKLRDIKGRKFTVFVTSTRNDWASNQVKKRIYQNFEEKPIRTFVAKNNGTLVVCTNMSCAGQNYIDVFGSLIFKHKSNQLTSTFPITQTCVTFIVPKSERMPQYMNIILPFRTGTWLMCFVTVPILALLWKSFHMPQESTALLEVIRLALSGATAVSVTRHHHRILLSCYLILSLIMMNAYTGSLSSYLNIPHYYPDINTLEELLHFCQTIYVEFGNGEYSTLNLLDELDLEDPLIQKFISLFKLTDDNKLVMHDISQHKNVCLMTASEVARIAGQDGDLYDDGYPLFHVMNVCPLLIQVVYQFSDVSPYTDIMDRHMQKLFESGILFKWRDDDVWTSKLHSKGVGTEICLKPIDMSHVSTSFCLLCGGLLILLRSQQEALRRELSQAPERGIQGDMRAESQGREREASPGRRGTIRVHENGNAEPRVFVGSRAANFLAMRVLDHGRSNETSRYKRESVSLSFDNAFLKENFNCLVFGNPDICILGANIMYVRMLP